MNTIDAVQGKVEISKGIHKHLQLAINRIDGAIQTANYQTRFDAQVDVDSKYAYRIINKEEWNRLTDLLSKPRT